jgi:hypothetical protein
MSAPPDHPFLRDGVLEIDAPVTIVVRRYLVAQDSTQYLQIVIGPERGPFLNITIPLAQLNAVGLTIRVRGNE